ncbi:MAG: hypothetical protein U9Q05_04085 [Thermodesulfobacteriota bacterium]|nr:hypothetical protein [Thermodesulfobacteriota bacterium]
MKRTYPKTIILALIITILIGSEVCWALSTPILYHPIDNSHVGSTAPYFEWNPLDEAEYYILIVTDNSDKVIHKKKTQIGNYRMPTNILKNDTKYSWQIKAYARENGESRFSAKRSFTTTNCHGIPGWPDKDCDGIIDAVETEIIFTDPDSKTLFIKPLKIDSTGDIIYWKEFARLFVNEEDILNMDQFTAAGIEIIVIGNQANGYDYKDFNDWLFDPTKSDSSLASKIAELNPSLPDALTDLPDYLPCDIMEIVYAGANEYCDRAACHQSGTNAGQISFFHCETIVEREIKEVSLWTWDTLALVPNKERPHRYFRPEIYPIAFDNYFLQGPYLRLNKNSKPVVLMPVVLSGDLRCIDSPDSCMRFSPTNLYDADPSLPNPCLMAGPANRCLSIETDTVEFTPYVFNKEGMITYAPSDIVFDDMVIGAELDKNTGIATVKPYRYNEVLRRIIVHEMGHALLRIDNRTHCGNSECIMCRYTANWEGLSFGTKKCKPDEKEYVSDCCEHNQGGLHDIRADGVVNNFKKQ